MGIVGISLDDSVRHGERPLGIPTIRDRVVQTAAKLVLEPIFDADLSDSAFGYREGRSIRSKPPWSFFL